MSEPESVELAAVLIIDAEGRYLVDFNDNWGCFTFPMSKLHELPATVPGGAGTLEPPLSAALRAAAELLGRPLPPASLAPLTITIPPYNQSGRDGKWKRYSFHLFAHSTQFTPQPLPGHTALGLSRKDLEELEPVSPTVRKILAVV